MSKGQKTKKQLLGNKEQKKHCARKEYFGLSIPEKKKKRIKQDFISPTCDPVQSAQSLSHVWPFVTPWTAACQASLYITNSWSLLKLMSIESVMPSNHLILCHLPLFLPSIFPSIRIISNESVLHTRWPKYWSFGFDWSFAFGSVAPLHACSISVILLLLSP